MPSVAVCHACSRNMGNYAVHERGPEGDRSTSPAREQSRSSEKMSDRFSMGTASRHFPFPLHTDLDPRAWWVLRVLYAAYLLLLFRISRGVVCGFQLSA